MTARIERLDDLPAADFVVLLAESEQAGLRFLRRLVDEWASGVNRFDRPGEALFGAQIGHEWVARLYEWLGFLRRADVPHCSHVLELVPGTGARWS
jgi:hypothetical protein